MNYNGNPNYPTQGNYNNTAFGAPGFPGTPGAPAFPPATNPPFPGAGMPPNNVPRNDNWTTYQDPNTGRKYLFDQFTGHSCWESERGLRSEYPWSYHFDNANHKYRFNGTTGQSEWVYS